MVFDSSTWKRDLLTNRETIRLYNTKQEVCREDYEVVDTILQKAVFYSAFIIRKLIECQIKTSDEVDKYLLTVKRYKALKQFVPTYHWTDEKSHDWEHPASEQRKGYEICNWLIHSFFFEFLYNEKTKVIDGFYVASDYDRNKDLYFVQFNDWLVYMDFVANDVIVDFNVQYGLKNGERVIVSMKKTRGDMSLGLLENARLLADSKKNSENEEGKK